MHDNVGLLGSRGAAQQQGHFLFIFYFLLRKK
jgi:hypothetical protein